jgi:hypothetical protein
MPRGEARIRGCGKILLALVVRPSAANAQGEAAKTGLPADWMPQSRLLGANVHSALVDVMLPRPAVIFGFESLEYIQSASELETEWDPSNAPQRAAQRTGMEPVDGPFANKKIV